MQSLNLPYSAVEKISQLIFCNIGRKLNAALLAVFISSCFITNLYAENKIKKLVVFGDSLVAGYNLPAGTGIVEQLQKHFDGAGYQIKFVNAGVSGDTTAAGLARLDWSVGDDVDAVFLELGANDMLRGTKPSHTKENLIKIIEGLKARNIKVFLAGMVAAPNLGKAYGDEFNALYPTLAKAYDLPLYPFILDGVATHPALIQSDGLHPNEKGVLEMLKRIAPFLKQQLDK